MRRSLRMTKLKRAVFAARILFLLFAFGFFVVNAGNSLDGIIRGVGDGFLVVIHQALLFKGLGDFGIHETNGARRVFM
jgi:hypothetical protein